MKFPLNARPVSPAFLKYFLLVLVIACVGVFVWSKFYTTTMVRMGGEEFVARVADTEQKRATGLSGSQPLERTEAMLFVFHATDQHVFWMKGLTYPLDVIWILNGQIVDIAPRVPPPPVETLDRDLPRYAPRLPVDRVLEVAAGTADRLGLRIGDQVQIT